MNAGTPPAGHAGISHQLTRNNRETLTTPSAVLVVMASVLLYWNSPVLPP